MYPNLLVKRASLTPNRSAIIFEDRRWTFLQLKQEAIDFAEKLHMLGINKGMRIAILASSNPQLVTVLHGCMQLGCELVMLNERLTEEELLFQLNDSQPDVLLVDSLNRSLMYVNRLSFDEIIAASNKQFKIDSEWPKDRTITIMYTSGTTGNPKGVRQTLENHVMSATGSALNLVFILTIAGYVQCHYFILVVFLF